MDSASCRRCETESQPVVGLPGIPPRLPAPLVLASTSRYRVAQLGRLGVPFTAVAPAYAEEPIAGVAAADLPLRHALGKVAAVAALPEHRGAWIVGADQGVVCDGRLIGKPHSADRAVEQLIGLAGRSHLLRTGVALRDATGRLFTQVVDVEIGIVDLTRAEAEAYVAHDLPLDCAGSYRVESAGPWLFSYARGDDPTAIEGLPLVAVAALIRAALAASPSARQQAPQ